MKVRLPPHFPARKFPFILAPAASEFGYTLNQVNWLGNVMTCTCMPVVLAVPAVATRFGLRKSVGRIHHNTYWQPTQSDSLVFHRSGVSARRLLDSIRRNDTVVECESIVRPGYLWAALQRHRAAVLYGSCAEIFRDVVRPPRSDGCDCCHYYRFAIESWC
jgi:hypothetical protein